LSILVTVETSVCVHGVATGWTSEVNMMVAAFLAPFLLMLLVFGSIIIADWKTLPVVAPWGFASVAIIPMGFGLFMATESVVTAFVPTGLYAIGVGLLYARHWRSSNNLIAHTLLRMSLRNHVAEEMARDVCERLSEQCKTISASSDRRTTQQFVCSIQAIMNPIHQFLESCKSMTEFLESHSVRPSTVTVL